MRRPRSDNRSELVEVRILGPLEIRVDGRAVVLGAGRQRALHALLALHPNQVVSRDRLSRSCGRVPPRRCRRCWRTRFPAPKPPRNRRHRRRKAPGTDWTRASMPSMRALRASRRRGRRALDETPRACGAPARSPRSLAGCSARGLHVRAFRAERDRPSRGAQARRPRGSVRRRSRVGSRGQSSCPSSNLSSRLIPPAHDCAERSCSRCTGAVAKPTPRRVSSGESTAPGRARSRARSCASRARAGEPRPGPFSGLAVEAVDAINRGRRRRWLIAAVIVAVVSGVAARLVLTRGAAARASSRTRS